MIPYLYAVQRADQVPHSANARTVLRLRDEYRATHFSSLVPDMPGGEPPPGDWTQPVGASYDRRIVALRVKTTPEQDDALVAWLNARENAVRFNLLFWAGGGGATAGSENGSSVNDRPPLMFPIA